MNDEVDPKTYFSLHMRREGKDVNVNFDGVDVTVGQVLEEVLHFMKACGYSFEIDDYLDVANDFSDLPFKKKETLGHVGVGTPGFNGTMELDFSSMAGPDVVYPDLNTGFFAKPEG